MEASGCKQNFGVSDRQRTKRNTSRRLKISAQAGLATKTRTRQKKKKKYILLTDKRPGNEHIRAAALLVMPSTVAAKVNWEFKPGSVLMEGLLRRVTVSALHSAYKDPQNSGLQDGEGATTD